MKYKIIFDICDFKDDLVLDFKELEIIVFPTQITIFGSEILKKTEPLLNGAVPALRSKP
jgi:hypothetical protein